MNPEDLKGEYERLLYLWGEELYSDRPDWEKLDQWNEELKGVEGQLALLDLNGEL